MMKMLSRRLLRVVMITLLDRTRQVSEQRKRIGFAHDAVKSPRCHVAINAYAVIRIICKYESGFQCGANGLRGNSQ
jgi:hypothetical protein